MVKQHSLVDHRQRIDRTLYDICSSLTYFNLQPYNAADEIKSKSQENEIDNYFEHKSSILVLMYSFECSKYNKVLIAASKNGVD